MLNKQKSKTSVLLASYLAINSAFTELIVLLPRSYLRFGV